MSSILRALKKLEDEQAGRASSAAAAGGQYVTPARSASPLLLLAGGVFVGLLLAGGLYALLGQRSSAPTAAETTSAPAPPPVPTPTPATDALTSPGPASRNGAPAAEPRAVNTTVDKQVRPAPATPPAASSAAVPVSPSRVTTPVTPQKPAAGGESRSGGNVEQVAIERREIPAPGQQWTAPHLVVSEILPVAGGERMAIVNGLPVMEGTAVEGAVVSEIRPDGVVFLLDGKSVTVPAASPFRQH